MIHRWLVLVVLALIGQPLMAQTGEVAPQPVETVIVLSTANDITVAKQTMPNNTLAIDYRPGYSDQWARVDGVGIPRYHYDSPEGVYTAPPFSDGFTAPDALSNKLWTRQIAWSPQGDMLAFVINNAEIDDMAHGVWFWQPRREIASDPSYQLLRQCPPYCNATTAASGQQWHAESLAWSPDNNAILIDLTLPNENDRRALTVRYAERDLEQKQATSAPNIIRFEYGHWTLDGQNLIVSGRDANGQMVFGLADRSGNALDVIPASEIGMVAVRDAVQVRGQERLVMLGSAQGANAPMQIVDSTGEILTPLIGTQAPDAVEWAPDGSAVMIRAGSRTFVATINGAVYDITNAVGRSVAIDWVDGAIPSGAAIQPQPQPLATLEPTPTDVAPVQNEPDVSTPEPAVTAAGTAPESSSQDTSAPASDYVVGDLLKIAINDMPLYVEPLAEADSLVLLNAGTEIIITGGPAVVNGVNWWRIQTLEHAGWVPETLDNGAPVFAPVDGPTG